MALLHARPMVEDHADQAIGAVGRRWYGGEQAFQVKTGSWELDWLAVLSVGCVVGMARQDDEHGLGRVDRMVLACCRFVVAVLAGVVDHFREVGCRE